MNLLETIKVIPFFRTLKRFIMKRKNSNFPKDTLAVSPHVNFFHFKEIKKIINNVGLKIDIYQGRTFICGFPLIDKIINKFNFLLKLNNYLGSKLPHYLVSDWMFVLKK